MKIKKPLFASLFDIPISISEDNRRQKLLDAMLGLLGFAILVLLISIFTIWITGTAKNPEDLRTMFFFCIFAIPSLVGLFVLNHSRAGYLARLIFVVIFLLGIIFFDTPAQYANGRSLLIFSVSIIAAGILIQPSASFFLAVISSIIVQVAVFTITPVPQPLPSILVFFLLAALVWMSTSSLERHIKQLGETNEALKQSEERYRTLVEISPDMITLCDLEEKIVFTNQAGLALFGYIDAVEVVGKKVWEFIAPEERTRAIADFGRVLQNNISSVAKVEYCALKKEGTPFFLEMSSSVLKDSNGQPQAVISVVRDITLRKRMEQALLVETEIALRESEQRYRDLFENASLAIFQDTLEGKVIEVNPEFARLFGYQSPEDVKASIKDTADLFADPRRRAEIVRLRAENPSLERFENVYRRKDGSIFIGQLTFKPIKDVDGQLQSFEGFIEDITSRKQIESALRESEERYRTLAEAAKDIIVIVTPDDRIAYINQFGAVLVGMAPEEIIGLPRSHFFQPAINDRHQANLQKVVEHGKPMFTESLTPFPTGEIWLSNWLVPLKDETGAIKGILGISRNITERKTLEESLLEAKNSLEQRVAERTVELINSREKLRRLTRQTVMTQENERRRLSRELHDEAGQALIGLKFSLDEILAETPENQEDIRRKISKTITRTDDLNEQIRNLAHGLRPPILDVAGIDLALNGFCREFSEETHFPVTYSGSKDLPSLSDETSITLYRFTQEAITNVIKHARASEARVILRREADTLTLSVKDNGKGFDVASTPKGIGLLGMEERLGLLGGRLEIRSDRKHGTHLKAVIPLISEKLSS